MNSTHQFGGGAAVLIIGIKLLLNQQHTVTALDFDIYWLKNSNFKGV